MLKLGKKLIKRSVISVKAEHVVYKINVVLVILFNPFDHGVSFFLVHAYYLLCFMYSFCFFCKEEKDKEKILSVPSVTLSFTDCGCHASARTHKKSQSKGGNKDCNNGKLNKSVKLRFSHRLFLALAAKLVL